MKNKFQSFEDGMRMAGGSIQHPLSIHSASIGTCRRHRVWQVLMTLVFLFTLSIGNVWAAASTSTDGKYASGTVDFSAIGTLSANTTYWHNGIKFFSGNSADVSANTSAWSEKVSIPAYISEKTASNQANKGKWGKNGNGKQYTMSGFACSQHTIGVHVNQPCTLTVVVNKNLASDTDNAGITASIDATAYATAWTTSTYKVAGDALTVASTRADATNAPGRYTLTIVITNENLTDGEAVVKMFNGSSGTGSGKLFCWESITVTAAAVTNYTVTIDPNGGSYASTPDGWTYDDVNKKYTKSFTSGTSFSAPAGLTKGTDDLSWKDNHGTTITFPVTLDKDSTFVAQWAAHTASSDATLSALSVAGCTFNETFAPATTAYTVDLPFYASMPATTDVTATKNDANAKTPAVSISSNVITVACEAEDGSKLNYTITVTIASTPTASSSINIEQLVLNNGTKYDIGAALDAAHIAYVSKDALDSLKNQADRNEPFLGLKFKATDSKVTIIVPSNQSLKVKFGSISGDANLKVSVNGSTAAAPTLSSNVYTLAASEGVKEVIFSQTGNKKTVVYKQIKVNADIDDVQLPWLVTYDAGEHGTCATAKEVWWGTALTLPSATPEDGWSFDGWNDDEDNPVSSPYTPTKDVTLTAQYTALASPFDLTALTYKIGAGDAVNVGYEDGTFTYNIELPYKPSYDAITVAPTLKVGTSSIKEGAVLTVSSLPGAATFTVVEAGGANEKLYTVNFTKAAKDPISIIETKVTAQNAHGPVGGLIGGDAAVKNASNFKLNTGNYVGVTLAGSNKFQAGDVVAINVTNAENATGFTLYTTNDEDSVLIIDTRASAVVPTGINYVTIPATYADGITPYEGTSSIYLLRQNNDFTGNMNARVDSIAVLRAMNPVLKSITFDGTKVNVTSTSVAATLPHGADLTAVTAEYYWNGAGTAVVTTNEGVWAWGENTYKLTDKDGDATTYTITLTEEDYYEAQIGTTKYSTVTAAFAAVADGKTIQLLQNCSYSTYWDLDGDALTGTKTVTLDLNGNDLTYTGTKRGVQVSNGAKLILMDGTATVAPTIDLTASPMARTAISYTSGTFDSKDGMCALAGSEIVINSGRYLATEGVILVKGPAATATVNDGVLICRDNSVISGNGTNSDDYRNYVMNIHGGILYGEIFSDGYASMVVYHPNVGTLNIDGGILVSTNGPCVVTRGGTTNITGGTLVAIGDGTGKCGDASLVLPAVGVAIDFKSAYPGVASTNVGIGGTVDVTGEAGAVLAVYKAAEPTSAEVNAVGISGGQFSSVLTQEVCAEGFAPSPVDPLTGKYGVIDQRIYIFDGSTMSNMATSPSGAIAWAKVGDVMSATDKSGTYDEVNYTKALQLGNSSTTKHFKIDVALNNAAKVEVIGMSNSSSGTRHAWLTNSTEKGEYASAIAGLATTGYNPEMFATDWLEEGSYYLHADNTVNIFLIRVTPKAVDPKCEQPTITAQPETNITFGAGNLTATVEAKVNDGGTLKYQWYNAANDEAVEGATSATLTTTTEGTYYVIVTNTLANHRDNSIKSDEAELGYRVTSDATLMALSYGTPATAIALEDGVYDYVVNLAKGTTDVPALAATATMHPYATVVINDAAEFVNYEAISSVEVTSEDGTDQKTYTVHFYVAHPVAALVDVTENTTWDWTAITARADGSEIDVPSGTKKYGPSVTTEDGLVLANYVLGGDNWDKIEGNDGAYAIRSSTMQYYQGASLHFHTTKGGIVVVDACNEGHTMKLKVENGGRVLDFGNLGSWKEYKFYAVAGDVVIYNESADGYPMRVRDITFTVKETPDYTRDQMLGAGVYGTICVPNNVPAGGILGITVYELMGREPQYGKLAFDEVTEMEAGVPYVFQAHGDELALFYGETSVANPVDKGNGMYGTFVDINLTDLNDVYYFAQRALWGCADLTSLSVPANRAYVKLSEIDYLPSNSAPAPGRRRITMTVNGQQVVTGIDNLNAGEQAVKLIIDGKMYILRGEKMYDATGKLVK